MISPQDLAISGAYILNPKVMSDDRGRFSRVFCRETLMAYGCDFEVAQINSSLTYFPGVIRGLHFQGDKSKEQKIVRCVAGSIFDVIADNRVDSPTYGKWFGAVLSAENREMLVVPSGVAHGFQALEPSSEVIYATSANYSPEDESGFRWDDPFFQIDWPIKDIEVSEKDRSWPYATDTKRGG